MVTKVYLNLKNWKRTEPYFPTNDSYRSLLDTRRKILYGHQEALLYFVGIPNVSNGIFSPPVLPHQTHPTLENDDETSIILYTNDDVTKTTTYHFDQSLRGRQITVNNIYNLLNRNRQRLYGISRELPKLCWHSPIISIFKK